MSQLHPHPNDEATNPAAIPPSFTTHPSLLTRFNVSHGIFLQQNPNLSVPLPTTAASAISTTAQPTPIPIRHLATGAILIHPPHHHFSSTQPPRVLLLRRAPTDSMPNLWEVPGGAVDLTDTSLLTGIAREMYEEASLVPSSIGPLVGPTNGQIFASRSGKLIAKFHFLVEVDGTEEVPQVKCDPAEHSQWVWVEEGEVQTGRVRGMEQELKFTTREQREVVLEGFRLWRELRDAVEKGRGSGV